MLDAPLDALLDALLPLVAPLFFLPTQQRHAGQAGVKSQSSPFSRSTRFPFTYRFAARAPCDSKGSEWAAKEKPTPISQIFLSTCCACGIPVDVEMHSQLLENWDSLKERLAADVERTHNYGVFKGTTFKMGGFEALLDRLGIRAEWPTTPTGHPMLDDDGAFKDMATLHPELEQLRQVRNLLQKLRTFKIGVGKDGRSRYPIMPFSTITGRNAPPASKFVFGPS